MGEDKAEAGLDLAALRDWMDRERLGSGPLEHLQRLTGGTQNLLLRFGRTGRDYVLRRPPEHVRSNSNETMRREARLLGALAGSAVPHPSLIAACGDESVLGAAFYLMEPVEGFNAVAGLPSSHCDAAMQHAMGLSMIEALAELHALDPLAIGLAGFGKVDGFLERQVARWRAQLDGYADGAGWPGPGDLGNVDQVGTWLDENRPADFAPGILHGDFHIANVMFRNDGPDVAAIVDWELATLGDPLIDLGWMLATWPDRDDGSITSVKPWIGFPTGAELVAHYAQRSSRRLDAIDWYGVFACYKLGILLEGTHARSCAGKAPKATGDMLHARAVRLFARARRWIEKGVL